MRKLLLTGMLVMTLLCGKVFAGEVVKVLTIHPNMPEVRDYYLNIIKKFETENPGIKINFEFLDDTSFKAKLPTLLQSPERPDAFFTWSGGVFHEQADVGILEDISSQVDEATRAQYSKIGIDGMSYNGKLYGIPIYASSVLLWYNKGLLDKAGIDPDRIKTWDNFLDAVAKLKAASITPIVVGGKSKWPLHFYYGFLATRIAGTKAIADASQGSGEGLNSPDFIRAGQEFKRLIDLKPFQPGFMDTDNVKAVGMFGDGKGAFFLMANFVVSAQAKSSATGKGLGDSLGCIPFPALEGGKGQAGDTFGGINGFLVSKGANANTVKFLTYLTNIENQLESGRQTLWIPIGKDAEKAIVDARLRQVTTLLGESPNHQLFLDQDFGAIVGAAINDAAAELASGGITPEEAAEKIEEARQMR